MASKSLGPFPKSLHWRQILDVDAQEADASIMRLISEYQGLVMDESALHAITFLVAMVVCSREKSPHQCLSERYGIRVEGPPVHERLVQAINDYIVEDCPAKSAAQTTLVELAARPPESLFEESDPSKVWREYDGSSFCDLAKLFFSKLNEQYFAAEAPAANKADVKRFAWEMSLITRSFSARWFNACARYEMPELGSIRWYLGHCLGKIELELERELSTWVEPTGNPWRRKRKNHNAKLL